MKKVMNLFGASSRVILREGLAQFSDSEKKARDRQAADFTEKIFPKAYVKTLPFRQNALIYVERASQMKTTFTNRDLLFATLEHLYQDLQATQPVGMGEALNNPKKLRAAITAYINNLSRERMADNAVEIGEVTALLKSVGEVEDVESIQKLQAGLLSLQKCEARVAIRNFSQILHSTNKMMLRSFADRMIGALSLRQGTSASLTHSWLSRVKILDTLR